MLDYGFPDRRSWNRRISSSAIDYIHRVRSAARDRRRIAVRMWVGLLACAVSIQAQEPPSVLVGRIDGEINLAQSAYVKRLVERAESEGVVALAIELNTFGGRVDAAVAIRDQLLDAEVDTVVFINKRAISAGALISLACKHVAISPGGTIGAAAPVMSGAAQQLPQAVEEKYLSYFRQEMRVTAEATGRNGDIAAAMVDADVEIPGVSESGKLLTLTTRSAVEHGIADTEATSLTAALAALGYEGESRELERSWAETLAAFLASQLIASLLFMGMMVLGYLEYQSPGFGVFGAGALICFVLLYFSHYLVNLAGWEEILLLMIGILLLLVELLVLPGFGIAGVAGLLTVLASGVMMFLAGDWGDLSFQNPFSIEALFRVLASTAVAMVTIGILIRFLPRVSETRFGARLVLTHGLDKERGYVSHRAPDSELMGKRGVALTPLRPSGKALIEGRRLNVETQGGFVDQDQSIEVVSQSEGRLVVRGVAET